MDIQGEDGHRSCKGNNGDGDAVVETCDHSKTNERPGWTSLSHRKYTKCIHWGWFPQRGKIWKNPGGISRG